MNVPTHLCMWIFNYLTDRKQHVCLHNICSSDVTLNTGAPQGTVLAPVLFTLYTNDWVSHSNTCQIIKYEDDTALVGCISDNDANDYRKEIEDLVKWCEQINLSLNVKKPNEMVFD
eukprot:GHVU01072129.1.p1 GENE.GHVU01072129.1~~GHVU01072129.1.p1  ORF type:complete len:116 (-),score=17.15 GHVU01072129.1:75-422(-)